MWFVYIVECGDGTYYTGISTDVVRRIHVHNSGRGAKYTRTRLPVQLVYSKEAGTKSEALKEEAAIKRLTRRQKEILVNEILHRDHSQER